MSRRDGYGTVHLRGFDVDHIPSAPFNPHATSQEDPRHLTLEDDSAARRRRPEHTFNPETGTLQIDLWFNNPDKDEVKQFIKDVTRSAKERGLRKVVIIVAAETAASIDAYTFFSRNHFERNTCGEPAGFIKYEKPVRPAESKPMDETDIKAARIKERSAQERVAAKELEPTAVPDFLRLRYESELKKLAEEA